MSAPISLTAVTTICKGQELRQLLQKLSLWDSSRRLQRDGQGSIYIPLVDEASNKLEIFGTEQTDIKEYQIKDIKFTVVNKQLPLSKKAKMKTPAEILRETAVSVVKSLCHVELNEDMEADLPTSWEVHSDLILFSAGAFSRNLWRQCGPSLWEEVAAAMRCKRLARKSHIQRDGHRTPSVELLLGHDGWVEHVDNGIRYRYDVTKCMFSIGNITEKLRVAKLKCIGEIVVDLYAGIGYFTLPYLVHAGASYVHACEWNPDAAEALHQNLQINGVKDRCTVYQGDNRQVCPHGVADRVNLGLIPSSEPGWRTACQALKPSGGILHIHGNVNSRPAYKQEQGCSNNCTMKDESGQPTYTMNDPYTHQCENGTSLSLHENGTNLNLQCEDDTSLVLPCLENSDEINTKVHTSASNISNISKGESLGNTSTCSESVQSNTKRENVLISSEILSIQKNDDSCTDGLSDSKKAGCLGRQNNKHGLTDSLDIEVKLNIGNSCEKGDKLQENFLKEHKSTEAKSQNEVLQMWAEYVSRSIQGHLTEVKGGTWRTHILHIEHVKSYAPFVDHLVLDLECTPEH